MKKRRSYVGRGTIDLEADAIRVLNENGFTCQLTLDRDARGTICHLRIYSGQKPPKKDMRLLVEMANARRGKV